MKIKIDKTACDDPSLLFSELKVGDVFRSSRYSLEECVEKNLIYMRINGRDTGLLAVRLLDHKAFTGPDAGDWDRVVKVDATLIIKE